MQSSSEFPLISIITPSYNQGQYLEETIQSVISQDYPNLEYIIIDGGSTDNSLDIIKKYEQYLAYWVSEPDKGQTDAINKGLKKSTGEIWSYLNSDDLLYPNTLHTVAKHFQAEIDWLGGISDVFDENNPLGQIVVKEVVESKEYLASWSRPNQYIFPCSNVCFMSRKILEKCGLFDSSYQYSMDIEYYARAIFEGGFKLHSVDSVMGGWRWHPESKTLKAGIAYGFREDEVKIAQKYLKYLSNSERQSLEREIKIQQLWLVSRKAIFDAKQGESKKPLLDLISNLYKYPNLIKFRPWYGALKQVLFDYSFSN